MGRSLEDIASCLKDMEQLLEALCQLEVEMMLINLLQLKISLIQIISDHSLNLLTSFQ